MTDFADLLSRARAWVETWTSRRSVPDAAARISVTRRPGHAITPGGEGQRVDFCYLAGLAVKQEVIMPPLDNELDAALRAVETSFHVTLVGTFDDELVWAPAEAIASSWLAEHKPEFDQFPVKDGGAAVGLLLRDGSHDRRTVREAMQPLRDGLIVSSDTPLTDLIPALEQTHCLLILRRGRIDGLVTQSDMVKLPVRMLLFGLISHLELCLRALVHLRAPEPAWTQRLRADAQRRIKAEFEKAASARLDLNLLEFTTFKDLLDVLQQDFDSRFLFEMEGIRELRNDIAHSKTYVQSPADVARLVATFASIRKSIDLISSMVNIG